MSKFVAVFYRCIVILCLVSCLAGPDQDVTSTLDDSFVNNPKPDDKVISPICYEDYHQIEASNVSRKLDILLIPDTSGSIKNERSRIAQGFQNFIDSLPSNVDYNIGVVLAHSSTSNQSGKLYKKNNEPIVLKSSELDIASIKSHLNTKLFNPKTDGPSDGGEMGMLAVLDALKPANVAIMRSQGFLREDASLAVVFIADEQDICAQYPEGIVPVPDPNTGEAKSFVKYCIEETVKWRDVNIGSSEYTYKITPELVVNGLKALQGERPLVIGGVLYNENSVFSTGNEDEIGYGYHDMIKLHDGISVDLGSGDYGDGLTKLGRLATAKMDLERTFAVKNQYVDPVTIQASVDNVTVGAIYDFELQKIFIDPNFDQLGLIKLNYCSDGAAPIITLDSIETQTDQEIVTLNGTIQDLYFDSYKVFLNNSLFIESTDSVISLPITLIEGVNTIRVEAKDKVGSVSEVSLPAISFTMNPPEIVISSEALPYTKESDFNFKATITDVFDVSNKIYVNNVLRDENSSKNLDLSLPLVEGDNIIKIVSTNSRGKVSESILDSIVKDATLPEVSFESSASGTTNSIIYNLVGSINELNFKNYVVKLNGVVVKEGTSKSINEEITLNLGSNSITVTAEDLAGNSRESFNGLITFESLAPQISLLSGNELNETNLNKYELKASVVSDLDVINKVYLNGVEVSSSSTKSINQVVTLNNGSNIIKITSVNTESQSTELTLSEINLDMNQPLVTWDIVKNTQVDPQTFTLDVKVEDTNYVKTIVKNNQVKIYETTDQEFELERVLVSGDNLIDVEVYDSAGNISKIMVYKIVSDIDTFSLVTVTPEIGQTVRGNKLYVSGRSKIPLSSITINGESANVSDDQLSYGVILNEHRVIEGVQ